MLLLPFAETSLIVSIQLWTQQQTLDRLLACVGWSQIRRAIWVARKKLGITFFLSTPFITQNSIYKNKIVTLFLANKHYSIGLYSV